MNKRQGKYLINLKWFRVYICGSFSKIEVTIGKVAGWGMSIYMLTLSGPIITRVNYSLKYLEKQLEQEGY